MALTKERIAEIVKEFGANERYRINSCASGVIN